MVEAGLIWLKYGSLESICEENNELSGSIKCWKIE
jgi:hypothetical protein